MTQHLAVPALDEWLGDALPGRVHLLCGGPGSGKSTACLYFATSVLRRGGRLAMLTQDRPSDLRSHAAQLGLDLRQPLRDGRLTLVRYRNHFGDRLANAAAPGDVVADLARLLALHPDTRVVIDPLAPFLRDDTGSAITALVEWLDALGTTVLLTWNGEPETTTDRRVDSMIERAAIILKFQREDASGFRAEVVRARQALHNRLPLSLAIHPYHGVVLRDSVWGARSAAQA